MYFPGFAMHFFNNCTFYKLHDPFHVTFLPPTTQRNTLLSNNQILITLTTITWMFLSFLLKKPVYMKKNYFFTFQLWRQNCKHQEQRFECRCQTVTFYFWGGSNSDEQPGWRGLLKITQNNLATKFYVYNKLKLRIIYLHNSKVP